MMVWLAHIWLFRGARAVRNRAHSRLPGGNAHALRDRAVGHPAGNSKKYRDAGGSIRGTPYATQSGVSVKLTRACLGDLRRNETRVAAESSFD